MAKLKSQKKSIRQLNNSARRAKGSSRRAKTSLSRTKSSFKWLKGSAKRPKILSRRALLFLVFAGLVFSLFLLFYLIPNRSIQSSSVPLVENVVAPSIQKLSSPGVPVRLKIPTIKVDAAIESVGFTPEGAVDVPKAASNAAWFNKWPRPGDIGNAIISGHYGPWVDGRKSVFDNLYKLKKGDKIYIEDEKGEIITFVVRKFELYSLKDDASDVFISTDGKAHLNLITCEGVWDKVTKSYSKRLVVFTDRE